MSDLPNYGDWARFVLSLPQDDVQRALMPATWPGLESWAFEPRDCASGQWAIYLDEGDE